MNDHLRRLEAVIRDIGPLAVAVSGGVDSMTLAVTAHRVLGREARMLHAVSPAVPEDASGRVHAYADREGWRLDVIDAGEFADSRYVANPHDRCFYCKTNLYAAMADAVDCVLISGTNSDDLGDYRPGLRAAADFGVRHPYVEAGMNKDAVRALARELGLHELAGLPASPCLSSRVETGLAIKPEVLENVDLVVVRELTGGIPIGFKLSAQHIEADIDFALEAGADYIIMDGRGGGTGAAPLLFRDNISVPTIPALARARRYLDEQGRRDVTLIITGGLRTEKDFVKALALGADAIAVSKSALQAIGCLGMRACHTNNCPVGIATQKPHLRERLPVDEAAERLARFFQSSVELMRVVARAAGHRSLGDFHKSDLTSFKHEMCSLTGVAYGGVSLD